MTIAAVLGAGSWGTALAIQLATNGHRVRAWDRDTALITALQKDHENKRYLPGSPFPASLSAEHALSDTVEDAEFILIAVPSYAMRSVCERLVSQSHPQNLVWATKGFEKQSTLMMHQVVTDVAGTAIQTAIISGPSFAKEVAEGLPTAVTLASDNLHYANTLAGYFHSDHFRVYVSEDVIGVEIGGAVKNVLAIAAGIVDGLEFGANARAALVTRGLAEMMRLGAALNANPKTLMGLAGMGDLVLTCTDNQSRNRRLGLALAEGRTAQQFMDELGQAVEGFHAAQVVHEIANDHHVEMPICGQVRKVLNEELGFRAAITELLTRNMKQEFS